VSKASASMSDSSKPSRLDRLADIQDIRDALTRYCRGTDKCDLKLAASAFHEDSQEDHGPFKGKSHDFLAMVMPILREQYQALSRTVTNVSVEFEGETALSEANWSVIMRDATLDTFQAGRYLDRWERRNGEWKIVARLAVIDWWRQDPRNAYAFPHNAESMTKFAMRGLENPEVRAAIGLR
jgi:hypothetical protein